MLNPNTIIGEIKSFAGDTLPLGYVYCNGQALDKIRYANLYTTIGQMYNLPTDTDPNTFRVPNCMGRSLVGQSLVNIGTTGGSNTAVIDISNLPAHNHNVVCSTDTGDTPTASGNLLGNAEVFDHDFTTGQGNATMSGDMISEVGGNVPLNVQNPFIVVNYIIYTGV